jgi:hypothetical protein
MNNNIYIAIFVIIVLCVLGYWYMNRAKSDHHATTYHKWILDPINKKILHRKNTEPTAPTNGSRIPESAIRNMIPGVFLDKYFPDSLVNQMPHKVQMRESFDTLSTLGPDIIENEIERVNIA